MLVKKGVSAQAVMSCRYVLSDRVQPGIQCLSQIGINQCRIRSSAFRMATYDDFLHLEMDDGILDDTGCVDIVGVYCIRYVAVHKDLAGLAVADGRLRDARIRASYPEDLGRLPLSKGREFIGVGMLCILQRVSVNRESAVTLEAVNPPSCCLATGCQKHLSSGAISGTILG